MASVAYTVKESTKSKHVLLRVSYFDASLTVVIPKGFNRRLIPEVLQERQSWIERARKQVAELRRQSGELPCALPERIRLRAIGREWQVSYEQAPGSVITLEENEDCLVLRGKVENTEACKLLLQRWLRIKAKLHLAPWLAEVSEKQGLPTGAVRVGAQRTRWASCSAQKTISLNQKLLFLPPELVDYVFIHELCHTVHLNHSRKFWKLVQARAPEGAALEVEMRTAWRYVPAWLDRNGQGGEQRNHPTWPARN